MTAKGNARQRPPVSWSDSQIRHHGAAALKYATQKELATQADIESWTGVKPRLQRKILAGRSLLSMRLLKSGRLRRHIIEYLRVCDRAVKKTLPRVSRARRSR